MQEIVVWYCHALGVTSPVAIDIVIAAAVVLVTLAGLYVLFLLFLGLLVAIS